MAFKFRTFQAKTATETAAEWLKSHNPKCWACGAQDWRFVGILFARVFPKNNYVMYHSIATARFCCNQCQVVFDVDCKRARIWSPLTPVLSPTTPTDDPPNSPQL